MTFHLPGDQSCLTRNNMQQYPGMEEKSSEPVRLWYPRCEFGAPALNWSAAKVKSRRAADAKEVGVGNPIEETCCHPASPLYRWPEKLCKKKAAFCLASFG